MNRLIVVIGVVVAIFVGLIFVASGNKISLEDVSSGMKNGALLVDVRTAEEYKSEHADGAINISLEEIQNGKYPEVSKDNTVYVYCHSGKRASTAKSLLESAGYKQVISLTSLNNWVVMGGKTEGEDLKCKASDLSSC